MARKHLTPPLIEVKTHFKPLWHRLFGHGVRVGNCGVQWDYVNHKPNGIAFFCYDCSTTYLEPWNQEKHTALLDVRYHLDNTYVQGLRPPAATATGAVPGPKVCNTRPRV